MSRWPSAMIPLVAVCISTAMLHADSIESNQLASALSVSLQSPSNESPLQLTQKTDTYQSCLPCHGAHGEGNLALKAPALAGQHTWYLERQLSNFRQGIRGTHENDIHGAAMRSIAMLLSDAKDQAAVLDEIEALPIAQQTPTLDGDLKAGAERYEISCANCHGDHAEGLKQFDAPRLNNLQDWYIARQLKKFQEGHRGEHDGDTTGKEMRPMAMAVYTEKELADVAAYIMSLANAESGQSSK